MQRLVVAGQSVFMEMTHQQLLRLIYCTCNEEGCSNWMRILFPEDYETGQVADTILLLW